MSVSQCVSVEKFKKRSVSCALSLSGKRFLVLQLKMCPVIVGNDGNGNHHYHHHRGKIYYHCLMATHLKTVLQQNSLSPPVYLSLFLTGQNPKCKQASEKTATKSTFKRPTTPVIVAAAAKVLCCKIKQKKKKKVTKEAIKNVKTKGTLFLSLSFFQSCC